MRNHFSHFCIASGLHFSTFGLTFNVLGGSLGPPWGTLGPRPLKTLKKTHFLGPHFEVSFWYVSHFWVVIFFTCFPNLSTSILCFNLGAIWYHFGRLFLTFPTSVGFSWVALPLEPKPIFSRFGATLSNLFAYFSQWRFWDLTFMYFRHILLNMGTLLESILDTNSQ